MEITAWGHPKIIATHKSTIEVTKENYLTERGDCIVGISSSHSLKDLKSFLKNLTGKWIEITFRVEDVMDKVCGYVHPDLTFKSDRDFVLRKSDFICDRTLMINSDKAAIDLDREIVSLLKMGKKLDISIKGKIGRPPSEAPSPRTIATTGVATVAGGR